MVDVLAIWPITFVVAAETRICRSTIGSKSRDMLEEKEGRNANYLPSVDIGVLNKDADDNSVRVFKDYGMSTCPGVYILLDDSHLLSNNLLKRFIWNNLIIRI